MKSLSLFVAISSANHFVFTGARLAVLLYALHLQASPAVVGVLAALFGLVSTFTSVAAGRWMDRLGPAQPMTWAAAIMTAGAALGFFWSDLAVLFIVSTLVGTFYNFFYLGHTQWLGRIGAPEDRLKNFNLASLGFSAAAFLGPLATGFVIDGLGHAESFLMLAIVPLFSVAVIALKAIEPPAGAGRGSAARALGQAAARRGSVMDLLRDRGLRRIYGVSVLANTTWSIVHFLIPVYGAHIGLSASTIGVIMGSYSFGSIVIRAVLQLLARRFTNWQLMLLSFSVSGVCFVIIPVVTSVPSLVALTFAIGLGMGLAGPLSQALLYEASPQDRVGEVMGLRVSAMNLTQTVVPFAAGAAGAALGLAPVFWALAAVLLGGSYAARGQWRPGKP